MYINSDSLAYPVTERAIKALHPHTSFPQPFEAPGPFMWVFPTPMPEHDPVTHFAREIQPELTGLGHWEQRWEVLEHTAEHVAAATAEKQAVLMSGIEQRVQERLNAFAATRKYDDVTSASKYKDISDTDLAMIPEAERVYVTRFRQEASYLSRQTAWTWAKLYTALDEIVAGTRIMPSSYEDIEAELPPLEWPV